MTLPNAHRWNKAEQPRKASALDGFAHVPPKNETALAQAVSQHPVAVAVCCGDNIDNWHQYTGGIFEIPNTGVFQTSPLSEVESQYPLKTHQAYMYIDPSCWTRVAFAPLA